MRFRNNFFNIYSLFTYIVWIFKGLGDLLNSKSKDPLNIGGVEQQVVNDNVYSDLLETNITEEVKELRHKSYVVPEKSKNYKYIGNGLAIKIENEDTPETPYDVDDLPIVLIQINKPIEESVTESLMRVDTETIVGQEYVIKIDRDYFPIYRLEEFTNKIIVKDNGDDSYRLELFTTQYPNGEKRKHKLFINTIKKLFNKELYDNSDIVKINKLEFITNKAFNQEDLIKFEFSEIKYYDCLRYEGDYILRFNALSSNNGESLIHDFIDNNTEMKYRVNAFKNTKN